MTLAELNLAFEWFNSQLFYDKLPTPQIVLERLRPGRMAQTVSEPYPNPTRFQISFDPKHFPQASSEEICSWIVHEMTHQWRAIQPPLVVCHHDELWCTKMKEFGLEPARPGKDECWDRIVANGRFARAAAHWLKNNSRASCA